MSLICKIKKKVLVFLISLAVESIAKDLGCKVKVFSTNCSLEELSLINFVTNRHPCAVVRNRSYLGAGMSKIQCHQLRWKLYLLIFSTV